MKTNTAPRRNWSRDELIVAFNLYCKTPFGRIHIHNPEIIALAKAIGRTPSSVAWKLANFARLDPTLQRRNIKGASHGSKQEVEIWEEFNKNWDRLAFESENLLAQITHLPLEDSIQADGDIALKTGKERESLVRVRVNQGFFRKSVLAAYGFRCCISGLAIPELLNASHIIPWADDESNRVNPRNGLCLNALLDRAFDRGLITVTPELKVKVSPRIKSTGQDDPTQVLLWIYNNQSIRLPDRFVPDAILLKHHNDKIFARK
ncbi:MAG: HNH endonuclease [Chloroflexi bacterium]|nr:HNH endonuclease [Chloroflexota bacterium]